MPRRTSAAGLQTPAPFRLALAVAAGVISCVESAVAADIAPAEPAAVSTPEASRYEWAGFYVGGHIGYAWGTSNWTARSTTDPASSVSGSLNFSQGFDSFNEAGSWLEGLQLGYNVMLANRVVLGLEADASFPAYQNLQGISIGSLTNFSSPSFGAGSYGDTLVDFGTVRARIGYAPGNWLFYATGGFAWTLDQVTLSQASTGASVQKFQGRVGWAAGVGAEFPITGHWTGKVEYLYSDYGDSSPNSPILGQRDRFRTFRCRKCAWA